MIGQLKDNQLKSAKSTYSSQMRSIKDSTEATLGGLTTALEKAIGDVDNVIANTEQAVCSIQLPNSQEIEQKLSEALGQIDQVCTGVQGHTEAGLAAHQSGLDEGGKKGATGFSKLIKATTKDANDLVTQFKKTAGEAVKGHKTKQKEVGDANAATAAKSKDAVKDMAGLSKQVTEGYKQIIGKLTEACKGGSEGLGKAFDEHLGKLDGQITDNAKKAADKVQPAWKAVLAFVLKVLITILVVLVAVILTAVGAGPLVALGIMALVGAIGGVGKLYVDNWAAGGKMSDVTGMQVLKAGAIGAVEGMVSLVGAGLATAATTAITKSVGTEIAKKFAFKAGMFLLDTAIGTAVDTAGVGIIKMTENLIDGKDLTAGVYDAMTDPETLLINVLGNAGGNVLGMGLDKVAKAGLPNFMKGADFQMPKGADPGSWKAHVKGGGTVKDFPKIDVPKVDIDAPKLDIDAPKVDVDAPKLDIDTPKVDVDAPKVDVPKADLDAPKADLDAPKADLDAPKADLDAPKADLDAPKADLDAPAKMDAPTTKPDAPSKPKTGNQIAKEQGLPDPPKGKHYARKPNSDEIYLRNNPKPKKPKTGSQLAKEQGLPDPPKGQHYARKPNSDEIYLRNNPKPKKHPLRQEYEDAVRAIKTKGEAMKGTGASKEDIAKALHADRRALGVRFKGKTPPEKLKEIVARNLKRYQDELGPTIKWLRARGKSWDDIIESSARPGGKDLGL